jgi:RNA polymerase sigma factor for flagellar operon FliA
MSTKTTRAAKYTAGARAPQRRAAALADRNALVEAHLPQVKYIAERLAARLPASVDREDLIGAGVLGLLDAVDKYDPARGVLFKTYAEMRVRGAMLDSLRDLDWAPRSMRQRAREVEAVAREIEQEHGRAAEEEEVAAGLGLTVSEFHHLLNELRGLTITGLDSDDEDEASLQARQIHDDPARTPLALYERAEVRDQLAQAIKHLPERERQVVALYYIEELSMKEVGAVLGVTESRVSQIHTQAVVRLRAELTTRRTGGALAF